MFALSSGVAVLFKRHSLLGSPLRLSRGGLCTILLSAILFTHPTEATAGMFDFFKKKYDVHLSPEVRGTVKLNGKPMPGLLVLRELDYIGVYEKTQKAKTDEQGRFSFPEKNVRATEPGSIFHEPRIWNVVHVRYNDEEYYLWHGVTGSLEPVKGKSDKLLQLNCDLIDSLEIIDIDNIEYPNRRPHAIKSICRW